METKLLTYFGAAVLTLAMLKYMLIPMYTKVIIDVIRWWRRRQLRNKGGKI